MKPKILYVAGISGFMEPKNGGQIRAHEILKQLCTQFEVDIFSPYLPNQLEGDGIRIANNICPGKLKRLLRWGSRRGFSRLINGYLIRKGTNSGHPLQNGQFLERSILERLIQTNHHQYLHVFFDTSRYAPLSPSLEVKSKSLLIAHNVDSVLEPNSSFHPTFEANLDRLFNVVITCTNQDAVKFQSTSPKVHCIVWPNGTEEVQVPLNTKRPIDILFVGALKYQPNIEAVEYLIQELHPLLRSKGLNLCIAGRKPSMELYRLIESSGATFFPDAPDISEIYNQSKLAVIPLFSGSGSRLKIAEALMHGLPVVSTAIGAEGYPDFHFGLVRAECRPVGQFAETIFKQLDKIDVKSTKKVANSAKAFLWHNTIDLSLLPS